MAELRPKPDWECEGDDLPPPSHIGGDRLQEQTRECVLRTHGNAENDGDGEERAEHTLVGSHAGIARGGGAERKRIRLKW